MVQAALELIGEKGIQALVPVIFTEELFRGESGLIGDVYIILVLLFLNY